MHFMLVVSCILIGMTSSAHHSNQSWKEKIFAEKVAFFTSELNLTPEEAQAFWPLYNRLWESKDKAHHQVMLSYRKLSQALDDGKPEEEISGLLDDYLEALDNMAKVDASIAKEYKGVLPVVKVAKLYRAEEKFRRMQINKLYKKDNGK